MPDCIVTATADSLGNASITMPQVASGLEWVGSTNWVGCHSSGGRGHIQHITAVVKRDGKVIDTTNNGNGGSMGGQPYYRFSSNNVLTITCPMPEPEASSRHISYTEHSTVPEP